MLIQIRVGKNSEIFSTKDKANDSKIVTSLYIKVRGMNSEAKMASCCRK